jgi:hypothetical protein
MKNIIYTTLCLLCVTFAACDKNELSQISTPASGAKIKLIHAAPGLPAIDGFVNNVKITPLISTSVTDNGRSTTILSGTVFANIVDVNQYKGVFPVSNDYSLFAAGNSTVKLVTSTPNPALVSPQTAAPGITVASVTQNFDEGKSYSYFVAGLPGAVTGILTEDKFAMTPAANKVFIRFANMIPNAAGALDLNANYTLTGGTATKVLPISNVAFGKVSDYVAIDANTVSSTSYTFQVSINGTTTNVGAVSSAYIFTPGRYYTLLAKGLAIDYSVPGTGITLKASARPNNAIDNKNPEIYYNPPGVVFIVNK